MWCEAQRFPEREVWKLLIEGIDELAWLIKHAVNVNPIRILEENPVRILDEARWRPVHKLHPHDAIAHDFGHEELRAIGGEPIRRIKSKSMARRRKFSIEVRCRVCVRCVTAQQ